MNDGLLSDADRKEAMSKVYAHAVAAKAGYVTAMYDYDRDSIDMRIQAGGGMRPAIEIQLKATINLNLSNDGCFHFPLKVKNYNELRISTQTPRFLVVLRLPRDESLWMTITDDALILRHLAYWLSLEGQEETTNRKSKTVKIPAANVFNVENLRNLMDKSRDRAPL